VIAPAGIARRYHQVACIKANGPRLPVARLVALQEDRRAAKGEAIHRRGLVFFGVVQMPAHLVALVGEVDYHALRHVLFSFRDFINQYLLSLSAESVDQLRHESGDHRIAPIVPVVLVADVGSPDLLVEVVPAVLTYEEILEFVSAGTAHGICNSNWLLRDRFVLVTRRLFSDFASVLVDSVGIVFINEQVGTIRGLNELVQAGLADLDLLLNREEAFDDVEALRKAKVKDPLIVFYGRDNSQLFQVFRLIQIYYFRKISLDIVIQAVFFF